MELCCEPGIGKGTARDEREDITAVFVHTSRLKTRGLLVPVRGCLTLDASGTLANPETPPAPSGRGNCDGGGILKTLRDLRGLKRLRITAKNKGDKENEENERDTINKEDDGDDGDDGGGGQRWGNSV